MFETAAIMFLIALNSTNFCGEIFFADPLTDEYLKASNNYWVNFDNIVPAIIAFTECEDDVVEMIHFVKRYEMQFRVRSGGHHYLGYSKCEGKCVVIDVSRMDHIKIKPLGRSSPAQITIGPGVSTYKLHEASKDRMYNEHELIVSTLGWCPSVHMGGFLLSGGQTMTARRTGYAIDHLLKARVVLADGEIVETTKHVHENLFYAIRGGGGGNFGVVTEYTLKAISFHYRQSLGVFWITFDFKKDIFELVGMAFSHILEDEKLSVGLTINLSIWPDWNHFFDSKDTDDLKPRLCAYGTFIGSERKFTAVINKFMELAAVLPTEFFKESFDYVTGVDEVFHRMPPHVPYPMEVISRYRIAKPDENFFNTIYDIIYKLGEFTYQTNYLVIPTVNIQGLGGAISGFDHHNTPVAYRDAFANVEIITYSLETKKPKEALEALHRKLCEIDPEMLRPVTSDGVYVGYPSTISTEPDYRVAYYRTLERYQRLQFAKSEFDPMELFRFPQMVRRFEATTTLAAGNEHERETRKDDTRTRDNGGRKTRTRSRGGARGGGY